MTHRMFDIGSGIGAGTWHRCHVMPSPSDDPRNLYFKCTSMRGNSAIGGNLQIHRGASYTVRFHNWRRLLKKIIFWHIRRFLSMDCLLVIESQLGTAPSIDNIEEAKNRHVTFYRFMPEDLFWGVWCTQCLSYCFTRELLRTPYRPYNR